MRALSMYLFFIAGLDMGKSSKVVVVVVIIIIIIPWDEPLSGNCRSGNLRTMVAHIPKYGNTNSPLGKCKNFVCLKMCKDAFRVGILR